MSCTWSTLVQSEILGFIFQLKTDGCKSNSKSWFGLCTGSDSWVKFDVARVFVSFDNSAIFRVLVGPLSHDNTQIEYMYSQLNA